MSTAKRQPKYRIVEDYLREQIASGEFAIDSLLPTEGMLCEQFGVSRATVRTALANIQLDGLITRSPATGSRVISNASKQEFNSGWGSFDDLLQYAKDARFEISERRKFIVSKDLEESLRFKEGRSLVCASGVRTTRNSSRPTCLLDVYFDALYGGILDYVENADKPIAALIEEHYRIRIMSIQQELSAAILSSEDAARLGVPVASAALVIKRWYFDTEGKVFEMSHATYPADQLHYTMTLGRSHG